MAGLLGWIMMILVTTGTPPCRADTLFLKNGQAITGIISAESGTQVTLDLGVGSMKINKSSILRIERADSTARDDIQDQWRQDYFLHRRHVPQGGETLAAECRRILDRQVTLQQARRTIAGQRQQHARLEKEIMALQSQLQNISRQLQQKDAMADPAEYNRLVARNNELTSSLSLQTAALRKLETELQTHPRDEAAYINDLLALRNAMEQAQKNRVMDPAQPEHQTFIAAMERRLDALFKEVHTHTIPARWDHGSAVVTVTLNNRRSGRFVVDSGASLISFSEVMAKGLGIDLTAAPEVSAVLADGREIKARRVLLQQVQVGDITVRDLWALVLPSAPSEDVDGLLGMNFLGLFAMSYDITGGKISFRNITPP